MIYDDDARVSLWDGEPVRCVFFGYFSFSSQLFTYMSIQNILIVEVFNIPYTLFLCACCCIIRITTYTSRDIFKEELKRRGKTENKNMFVCIVSSSASW